LLSGFETLFDSGELGFESEIIVNVCPAIQLDRVRRSEVWNRLLIVEKCMSCIEGLNRGGMVLIFLLGRRNRKVRR
jgi:hypothetical protein